MMEHGAGERVKEQLHMELPVKIKVEEAASSTTHVNIEIDLNPVKEEPGLGQIVKSEPALLVKQEVLEDNAQDSQHGDFKCDQCPKIYQSKISLIKHSKSVHATDSLKCSECSKEFKCKIYLSNHVRVAHGQRYMCEVCDKVYKSKRMLHGHVLRHHSSADSQHYNYRCGKCKKTYIYKDSLTKHYKQVHGTDSLKCADCNKKFKCETYLLRHVRNAHDWQHYNSRCDICMKTFHCKSSLAQHSKQVHGTDSRKCTLCNKEFKCEAYLLRHVRNAHGKPQYECNVCKKQYKIKQYLHRHILSCHQHNPVASDNQQGNESTSTPAIVRAVSETTISEDRSNGLTIKQEPEDTDLDIGPTVLQHMDSHYTTKSVKMELLKVEEAPLTIEQIVKTEPDLSMNM